MSDWKPRPKLDLDLSQLDLDAEEGFVLSRLDGSTPVDQLSFLTGLPATRVSKIVARLQKLGTLEGDGPPPEPETSQNTAETGNWRQLFETELRSLGIDRRVELARHADGDTLFALCFDPAPRVVTAVLENPKAGLDHARLVARHHRASLGLDALGGQAAWLRDLQLQRELYRNPQTSERLLGRLFLGQQMAQIYRIALGHEASERVRSSARKTFRRSFATGSADERVSLILKTEGRCLSLLAGTALDAKAAALLCRRALNSTLLVRNLLRWSSTPPPVLAHLARQPVVQRSPELRNHLLRHPNAPSRLATTLR